jgi:hypothetical protein
MALDAGKQEKEYIFGRRSVIANLEVDQFVFDGGSSFVYFHHGVVDPTIVMRDCSEWFSRRSRGRSMDETLLMITESKNM